MSLATPEGALPPNQLAARSPGSRLSTWFSWAAVALFGSAVVAVLIWQGITFAGAPDPEAKDLSSQARMMSCALVVFREGLEAVLILAALTVSLARSKKDLWKPITLGVVLSLVCSVATWFVAIWVLNFAVHEAGALHVQAATGLLAIVVLLVIMNWFFHKIYWTGWIKHHNRRKKALVESGEMSPAVFRGLVLLGFTSIYREGFEIVLFMQTFRLEDQQTGEFTVLPGVGIGLALTAMVAVLTFIAHQKLPYKKMLILTGVLLGVVLMVMVGEQVQEMQDAGWLSVTELPLPIPGWLGMWLAIFPNAEGLAAQALAVTYVLGSYFLAKWVLARRSRLNPPAGPRAADDADEDAPAPATASGAYAAV